MNTKELPKEIQDKIYESFPASRRMYDSMRSAATMGYSLAQEEIKVLEQTISDQDKGIVEQKKEIERLTGLLELTKKLIEVKLASMDTKDLFHVLQAVDKLNYYITDKGL